MGKLYDCRTTFYSRCKECNIEQAAISAFMGHSINKIDKAYTDLSKAYLHKEGLKFFHNF